ncbi:MAG TPA: hypothetical protein VFG23_01785 [Polyangia bacterium]|nr:hypothetical protein [Polyangia bacterium]
MENGSAVMLTWSKAGVIAEALGSIGIVFTLFYSVWSFTTTLRDAYYAELDRVYFELLKIGLERPELLCYPTTSPTSPTSPATPDPAKAGQYGAYAFMVWNFIETIFDRCQGWSKRKLRETWYPIIAAENALHRAWFDQPENRGRFKRRFVRFVETKYPS